MEAAISRVVSVGGRTTSLHRQTRRYVAHFNSRTARPAPARFVSFISEYFRDSSTPCAPPAPAAFTARYTSSGVVFLLVAAVGMSMSMPGQILTFDPADATARFVSRST